MNTPTTTAPAFDPERDGIVIGLPNEKYHGDPREISCSGLKDMARSPFHFYSLHRDPNRPERPEKPGQLHGTLAHAAILEPDAFGQRYVTLPPGAPRRPTSAQWKAKNPSPDSVFAMRWWVDWNERTRGKQSIETDEYETAQRQAESVWKLPEARELLAQCRTEVSAFATDPETGMRVRCRPDLVHPCGAAQVILGDVKTYGDASAWGFKLQVEKMGYDVQDQAYSQWYELAAAVEVLAFVFIAVEDSFPFAAACHMLDDESRNKAATAVRHHLDRYAECMRSGVWPSYPAGVNLLSVRSRALRNV